MRTSPPVYILAMLSFFGWFLMIAFAGVGLFALPMDLINDWRFRPVRMCVCKHGTQSALQHTQALKLQCNPLPPLRSDVAEFAKKKNELKEKTSKLLQIGKEKQAGFATHSNKRKERQFANQFKALV